MNSLNISETYYPAIKYQSNLTIQDSLILEDGFHLDNNDDGEPTLPSCFEISHRTTHAHVFNFQSSLEKFFNSVSAVCNYSTDNYNKVLR